MPKDKPNNKPNERNIKPKDRNKKPKNEHVEKAIKQREKRSKKRLERLARMAEIREDIKNSKPVVDEIIIDERAERKQKRLEEKMIAREKLIKEKMAKFDAKERKKAEIEPGYIPKKSPVDDIAERKLKIKNRREFI